MVKVDRRIGLLFALFLGLLVLSVLRATWLGTVRGGDLRGRALAQQEEEFELPARRGTITDRHGIELAVSEDAATVFAHPFLVRDPAATARRLAPAIGAPEDRLLRLLADRDRGYVYLARKLDPSRGDAVRKLNLGGVGVTSEPRRRYPQGSLASQLIGGVGTDNYGVAGIEQHAERTLHGSDGRRLIVSDALGKPVRIVDREHAERGEDLRLTIDAPLQERVEVVLAEVGQIYRPKGATALVVDPRSGEILALANWPPVEPHRLGDAPPYVRQNRAVAASYEPGSTFKAFTVAGGLEEGLIAPETQFPLPPTIRVSDRTIAEPHARGWVTLDAAQILAQSSNVGSVMIGLKLGIRRFDKWVRSFGFGASSHVDIPGEAAGIVLRPERYSGSSLGNMSIGQGLAVTPIQIAAGYSAIANGGVLRRPHVIADDDPAPARRVISARTAHQVSRMLEGVVGPGGTAEEAKVAGYRLSGKTGTAEKPDGYGGYSKTRFVASFIGYAPSRDPRLLVTVMVDEPQGEISGAEVAAPAFERIVSFALPYLRIPPG
jgi:cell division protein FtsI (penicillin-binding protein 3)